MKEIKISLDLVVNLVMILWIGILMILVLSIIEVDLFYEVRI